MNRLLIVGDSFCSPSDAEWAWTNQLSTAHTVINQAQNGVGQYKIHLQLESTPIHSYDTVIMSVTSAYRIHADHNPFYANDHASHNNCDLLYNDIASKDPSLEQQHILWWFENMFDLNQAEFIQKAIIDYDCQYLKNHNKKLILINFFPQLKISLPFVDLHSVWKKYPGQVNHLDQSGHEIVAKQLLKVLDS